MKKIPLKEKINKFMYEKYSTSVIFRKNNEIITDNENEKKSNK